MIYVDLDIFRPTKGKITLFIAIALAAIISILFSTHCNPILKISGITIYSGTAFTMCMDAPRGIDFLPGLYPPILFEEKLTYQNEPTMSHQGKWTKSTNSFGFSCETASCGECPPTGVILASCSISPIVPVYLIIYWYIIACMIALLFKTKFMQANGKKIAIVSAFLIMWAVFLLYLISNLINGTWGISLNFLGIVLLMIPAFALAYIILVRISS